MLISLLTHDGPVWSHSIHFYFVENKKISKQINASIIQVYHLNLLSCNKSFTKISSSWWVYRAKAVMQWYLGAYAHMLPPGHSPAEHFWCVVKERGGVEGRRDCWGTGLWGHLGEPGGLGKTVGFPLVTKTDSPAAQWLSHATAQPSASGQFWGPTRGSAALHDLLKMLCFGLKGANQNASETN